MISKPEILAIAVNIAKDHELDHELVLAIIAVESSFKPYSHRFEPGWPYFTSDADIIRFAAHNGLSRQTERIDQQTSFGYMHVMGSVARELGYQGNLADLYEPEYGIEYGCRKLKELVDKYENLDDAIASYNEGHPARNAAGKYLDQDYVDKVNKALEGKLWTLTQNKGA